MNPETQVDLLKQILENLRFPERLDDHPWTKSLIVEAEIAAAPALLQQKPGSQLAAAIGSLFKDLMPATPPKRGKRLDTRWGEFGLLAAQYFAPFLFGLPYPDSLRSAWGKIDQAIVWFAYGKPSENLSPEDLSRYKLVGDEAEVAANSTISDWHRKGIERFAELIFDREQHLSRASLQPSDNAESGSVVAMSRPAPMTASKLGGGGQFRRWFAWFVLAFVVIAGIFIANWAWKAYQQVIKVRAEVSQIQALASGQPGLETVKQAVPLIDTLHQDLGQLRDQTATPLKLLGPWLTWVPVYGADLAAASDLLDVADLTVNSARLSLQAAVPVVETIQSVSSPLSPKTLTALLVQAQPQIFEARKYLAQARTARSRINSELLSPKIKPLVEKLDPLLNLLEDGLSTAVVLPKILGASSDGPKNYMVLLQNEDELRATGGFLTSVGSFSIRDGELSGLKFENSEIYYDKVNLFPAAPWQMQQYMNIPVTLLRDANWSPDFPATVVLVEFLYAYQNGHSADGVIAINQQVLVTLLKVIGPIKIADIPEPINAENVAAYMREAKIPPEVNRSSSWDRKAFIGNMASAIMEKLFSGKGLTWETLLRAMLGELNQRHILLQFDDPDLAALVARHAWDGAVVVGAGDFLMSVDTNLGYNKTNSVVTKKLAYDVDLTDLANPKSSLVVFHTNQAVTGPDCYQWGNVPPVELWYAVNRCYYDYLRTYLPAGARLIEATPHAIPAAWMMLGQAVPARVDPLNLSQEQVKGVQGFGTLLVVPGQQSLSTSFRFALPARVISSEPGSREKSYTLKIQKQAGTRAIPLTLRIHLPTGAQVLQASPAMDVTANNLLLETDLTTDVLVKVVFASP